MATPIIMPRQGQSVESCIIAKWYKQKGDKVNIGDILFTYETDKATFDEEAKIEGIMLDIFFAEGDDVPCLLNVCVVGNEGESTSEFNPNGGSTDAAPVSTSTESSVFESTNAVSNSSIESTSAPASQAAISPDGFVKISPRAKNLADKAGIDYRYAAASGPYGRIIEQDVDELIKSGNAATFAARDAYMSASGKLEGSGLGGRVTTSDLSAPVSTQSSPVVSSSASISNNNIPEFEEVKLPNIRKVIAKAMQNSISTTCQLTLNSSFDATEIMAYRKKIKDSSEKLGLGNITLNDIILYAVSRVVLKHRELNAHFYEDKMVYFNNVNLGVAVDTERGLMVPTVFSANKKSLSEISRDVKAVADACQKGTITPDQLKGGTFTITNLGTLDIESFTPVLNAPQTGILGVCNITQRPREVKGQIEFYPAMGLSLTFDHKALDGAPAARFLKDLKNALENFSSLLAL
jgi:pyruvate dehydrogenase E2 component (dihydrolipoamide acetyltransferase)